MATVELLVPVFNEAQNIESNLRQILAATANLEPYHGVTVLVVDDGSSDGTDAVLKRFSRLEPRVRNLRFTRNFGKEAAILAGLEYSRAEAVVVLDCDLQHPPELIPQMVQLWKQGFKIVEAVKIERGDESYASRFLANLFYRLFRCFSGLDLRGKSDFKLLDRLVIDRYLKLREQERFFRGLIQWMNYPTASIPFSVPKRAGGQSRWSRLKLFRYAVRNITSFSAVPLQIVSWCGLASVMIGVVFATIAITQKVLGQALDGFTTVILLQIFFSGVLMLSLGIVGHYLARIHQEIKQRPSYLIDPEEKPAAGTEKTEPDRTS